MILARCSVDIPGTFEAKGIEDAKSRLKFVAAEVREPFPAEVKEAGVRQYPADCNCKL